MKSPKIYLFRVDAGSQVGFGHLSRCLAIAEELAKRQWVPVFVVRDFTRGRVKALLRDQKWMSYFVPLKFNLLEDAQLTIAIANRYKAKGILVDLNHSLFLRNISKVKAYLAYLKTFVGNLMVIDGGTPADCLAAKIKFSADAVFVPYFGSKKGKYQDNGSARFFLGPRYFIFKESFRKWAEKSKEISVTARNILVTIGGSDTRGLCQKVCLALKGISDPLKIKIVLGLGFRPSVEKQILKIFLGGIHSVRIVKNASNMAQLLYQADIAIVGGGLTKYEAAIVGTPMICLIDRKVRHFFKDNAQLRQLGMFVEPSVTTVRNAVRTLMADRLRRQQFSESGKSALDAKGTQRTADLLEKGFR